MALQLCPYEWRYPWDGLHAHKYRTPAQMDHPRWLYGGSPCCELCDTYESIPNLPAQLHSLLFHPSGAYHYTTIQHKLAALHHHYLHGLDRDDREAYLLSRELDQFARYLGAVARLYPSFPALGRVASGVRGLGSEMRVSPRRVRYWTVPRRRGWW